MIKSIYIGNTEFCLNAPCGIRIQNNLDEYLNPIVSVKRVVNYYVRFMEEPQPVSFQYLAQISYPPHIIGNSDTGECRIYSDFFRRRPVAMYHETGENEVELVFYGTCPKEWNVCLEDLNYLAIERQMIQSDSIILHSSFIVVNGEAILFTAPSGTGKSTQADLWERYGSAQIMNGDRTLLVPVEEGWCAAGFPFSGSSKIFHNGLFPVKALVMISQAPENSGEFLSSADAFKRSYPEIVRNYWSREYEDRVVVLLEKFLLGVSKIAFKCNMDEDAVRCLENILNIEGYDNEDSQK